MCKKRVSILTTEDSAPLRSRAIRRLVLHIPNKDDTYAISVVLCLLISALPLLQVSVKQLATSCPTSSERDFFRWLKLPIPTYKASVPVKLDASNCAAIDGLGTAEISLVLPSDHLQALHDQGPEAPPYQKNSQHVVFFASY